jgi:lipoprotein signal peptidase
MSDRTKRLAAVVVSIALVSLDRIAKWYATAALPPEGVALFPGVRFVFFKNPGLVFSLSVHEVAWVVSVIALIALVVVTIVAWRRSSARVLEPRRFAAGISIALGGLSNVTDRLFFGGVTDYLVLFARSAINIADIMILAGIVLLIYKKDDSTGGHSRL